MNVILTHRSSGYGYENLTELTQVPGIVARAYITLRSSGRAKDAVPVPRVFWHGAYRNHRSSGYGYESLTELPELPGIVGTDVQNLQKLRAGIKMLYPYPGYCGTVVQILQSSGHGYECRT